MQTFHLLLNPNSHIKIDKNKQQVVFQELSNVSVEKLQSVTIQFLPQECYAFSYDSAVSYSFKDKNLLQKPKNYFLNIEHPKINRVCDGVLFSYNNNKIHFLLLEMKSQNAGYEDQLVNAKLLIEYTLKLYQIFDNQSIEFDIQMVLFSYNHERRTITKHKRTFIRNSEDENFTEVKLIAKKMQSHPNEAFVDYELDSPKAFVDWRRFF